jgi:hypothetical protein
MHQRRIAPSVDTSVALGLCLKTATVKFALLGEESPQASSRPRGTAKKKAGACRQFDARRLEFEIFTAAELGGF